MADEFHVDRMATPQECLDAGVGYEPPIKCPRPTKD